MNVDKRKEILSRKRRCFKCTKGAHVAKDCNSQKSCYFCKSSGHHFSICSKDKKTDKDNNNKDGDKDDTKSKEDLSVCSISMQSNILLQTASLKVVGTRDARCNVLFDTGSQCSYITRSCCKKIDATVHHTESLKIGGFGGKLDGQKR